MNHLAVAQGIPIVPDGMGGGYYGTSFGFVRDERVESPVLIDDAHDFQKVDSVPSESWDMPLQWVVTPPDHTAWDSEAYYFDPKSDPDPDLADG